MLKELQYKVSYDPRMSSYADVVSYKECQKYGRKVMKQSEWASEFFKDNTKRQCTYDYQNFIPPNGYYPQNLISRRIAILNKSYSSGYGYKAPPLEKRFVIEPRIEKGVEEQFQRVARNREQLIDNERDHLENLKARMGFSSKSLSALPMQKDATDKAVDAFEKIDRLQRIIGVGDPFSYTGLAAMARQNRVRGNAGRRRVDFGDEGGRGAGGDGDGGGGGGGRPVWSRLDEVREGLDDDDIDGDGYDWSATGGGGRGGDGTFDLMRQSRAAIEKQKQMYMKAVAQRQEEEKSTPGQYVAPRSTIESYMKNRGGAAQGVGEGYSAAQEAAQIERDQQLVSSQAKYYMNIIQKSKLNKPVEASGSVSVEGGGINEALTGDIVRGVGELYGPAEGQVQMQTQAVRPPVRGLAQHNPLELMMRASKNYQNQRMQDGAGAMANPGMMRDGTKSAASQQQLEAQQAALAVNGTISQAAIYQEQSDNANKILQSQMSNNPTDQLRNDTLEKQLDATVAQQQNQQEEQKQQYIPSDMTIVKRFPDFSKTNSLRSRINELKNSGGGKLSFQNFRDLIQQNLDPQGSQSILQGSSDKDYQRMLARYSGDEYKVLLDMENQLIANRTLGVVGYNPDVNQLKFMDHISNQILDGEFMKQYMGAKPIDMGNYSGVMSKAMAKEFNNSVVKLGNSFYDIQQNYGDMDPVNVDMMKHFQKYGKLQAQLAEKLGMNFVADSQDKKAKFQKMQDYIFRNFQESYQNTIQRQQAFQNRTQSDRYQGSIRYNQFQDGVKGELYRLTGLLARDQKDKKLWTSGRGVLNMITMDYLRKVGIDNLSDFYKGSFNHSVDAAQFFELVQASQPDFERYSGHRNVEGQILSEKRMTPEEYYDSLFGEKYQQEKKKQEQEQAQKAAAVAEEELIRKGLIKPPAKAQQPPPAPVAAPKKSQEEEKKANEIMNVLQSGATGQKQQQVENSLDNLLGQLDSDQSKASQAQQQQKKPEPAKDQQPAAAASAQQQQQPAQAAPRQDQEEEKKQPPAQDKKLAGKKRGGQYVLDKFGDREGSDAYDYKDFDFQEPKRPIDRVPDEDFYSTGPENRKRMAKHAGAAGKRAVDEQAFAANRHDIGNSARFLNNFDTQFQVHENYGDGNTAKFLKQVAFLFSAATGRTPGSQAGNQNYTAHLKRVRVMANRILDENDNFTEMDRLFYNRYNLINDELQKSLSQIAKSIGVEYNQNSIMTGDIIQETQQDVLKSMFNVSNVDQLLQKIQDGTLMFKAGRGQDVLKIFKDKMRDLIQKVPGQRESIISKEKKAYKEDLESIRSSNQQEQDSQKKAQKDKEKAARDEHLKKLYAAQQYEMPSRQSAPAKPSQEESKKSGLGYLSRSDHENENEEEEQTIPFDIRMAGEEASQEAKKNAKAKKGKGKKKGSPKASKEVSAAVDDGSSRMTRSRAKKQ